MGRTILPSRSAGSRSSDYCSSQFFFFSGSVREKKRNWVLTEVSLTVEEVFRAEGCAGRLGFLVAHHGSSWRMVSRVAEPVRECPANERGVRSILETKSQPLLRQLGVEISCV